MTKEVTNTLIYVLLMVIDMILHWMLLWYGYQKFLVPMNAPEIPFWTFFALVLLMRVMISPIRGRSRSKTPKDTDEEIYNEMTSILATLIVWLILYIV